MPDYTLYYSPTPNGKKITLMLEELSASYKIHPISISRGDQHTPTYLKLNPNNKIPTLIDHTNSDLVIFESGAILEYLAEKHQQLLPTTTIARYTVKQWLYWQMAGFGPMLGQMGYFYKWSPVDVPEAKERYLKEALRLFGVLDRHLSANRFVGGEEYSIADVACYWWSFYADNIPDVADQFQGFEHVKRWQDEVGQRPAVLRATAVVFEP